MEEGGEEERVVEGGGWETVGKVKEGWERGENGCEYN